jgi:hypothetical protein
LHAAVHCPFPSWTPAQDTEHHQRERTSNRRLAIWFNGIACRILNSPSTRGRQGQQPPPVRQGRRQRGHMCAFRTQTSAAALADAFCCCSNATSASFWARSVILPCPGLGGSPGIFGDRPAKTSSSKSKPDSLRQCARTNPQANSFFTDTTLTAVHHTSIHLA